LKKIESEKFVARRPFNRLENAVGGLSPVGLDPKENHFHVAVRIAVTQSIDFLAHLGFNPQLFLKLSPERSPELFPVPNFAAGKLPLKSVGVGAVPLANQDFLPTEEDSCGYQNGFSLTHRKMSFYQTSTGNRKGRKMRFAIGS
jgi:hypothetical protein